MSACAAAQRVRFQLRRATNSQWETNNPTLLAGEPGLNTTTTQLKIGDGVTAWNNLPYINIAGITGEVGTPTSLIPVATLTSNAKVNKNITVFMPNSIVENQGIIFTGTREDTGSGGTIVQNTLYYAFANYPLGEAGPGVKIIQVKTSRNSTVAF